MRAKAKDIQSLLAIGHVDACLNYSIVMENQPGHYKALASCPIDTVKLVLLARKSAPEFLSPEEMKKLNRKYTVVTEYPYSVAKFF